MTDFVVVGISILCLTNFTNDRINCRKLPTCLTNFTNDWSNCIKPLICLTNFIRRKPPTMGKQLVTLSLAIACGVHPFCNLQSQERSHAVLVIGLYELLGNPTVQLNEPPGPSPNNEKLYSRI